MSDINHRARKILQAVVQEYIATGDAVGSRTITKRYGLELSPATVRNVMADLEEAGMLTQPHTSAGRVPTDAGLRYFVDTLLKVRSLSAKEKEDIAARYQVSAMEFDELVRDADALLAGDQQYILEFSAGNAGSGSQTIGSPAVAKNVIATGAVPVRPPLPGVDAAGVFGVQTLDDGAALLADLDRAQPRRAVVVGGGYIGVEMAEALVRRGVAVTVVDQAAQPMTTLDPDMGAAVHRAMEGIGIDVRLEREHSARLAERRRAIPGQSGCGICGLTTIEEALPQLTPRIVEKRQGVFGAIGNRNVGFAAARGLPSGNARVLVESYQLT